MNLRHAGALVLVGWYLMAPPFDRVSLTFRTDVPVSEWDNLRAAHLHWEGEFDSENECEEYKTHNVAFWQDLKAKIRGSDVKYQLSKWSIYHCYNTLDECRQVRSNITSGLLQDSPPDFLQRFGNNFKSAFARAKCVASDDPRLKEK